MAKIYESITELVGRTPLLELKNFHLCGLYNSQFQSKREIFAVP